MIFPSRTSIPLTLPLAAANFDTGPGASPFLRPSYIAPRSLDAPVVPSLRLPSGASADTEWQQLSVVDPAGQRRVRSPLLPRSAATAESLTKSQESRPPYTRTSL